MKASATEDIHHRRERGPHAASHPPWQFHRDAAVWIGDRPSYANLLPVAAEMCEWTKRKIPGLSVCTETEKQAGSFTNPYTYHATAIAVALAEVVNSAHDFATAEAPMEPLAAEIERIRLNNELVLYVARFCEATIKQMLFCTQIPRSLYERASLGQLLAIDCYTCRKAGRRRHDISLLGALAHQYFLCNALESCVFEHLKLVGQRRNHESAHSDSKPLHVRDAAQSRAQLAEALKAVGEELGHIADHLGQIERRMIAEIEAYVMHYPQEPSVGVLMRIPARQRQSRTAE
jgi:hypothetical protein